MFPPKPVTLSQVHVHMRRNGPAEFLAKDFSNVKRHGSTMIWDPGVDGILGGESDQGAGSDRDGERHLDGDEVLYLISGAMRLTLERDNGEKAEVGIQAGQAVVVPQNVWHRVTLEEPSRYLFFGGGRTEIRNR